MDPVPDRERNVYIAKLAEEANRYEDVIQLMKEVALMNVELTTEERDLMSSAYNNVIALRRCSWKTLVLIEGSQKMRGEPTEKIEEYIEKVAGEINGFCTEVTSILTDHVIPSCTSTEHRVVYYTMMGNCYGFLAELKNHEDMIQREEELITEAFTAYNKGTDIAEENLQVIDPIRLTLAWNLSVFCYEIVHSVKMALQVARRAVNKVRALEDVITKEAINCLQCLIENIKMWDSIARDGLENVLNADGDA